MRDLGLTYMQAMHGVQSSIASGFHDKSMEPKHMRTGIDSAHITNMGLAKLLMDKGVFTEEEYCEYIRLAANEEVAQRQDDARKEHGLPVTYR